MKTMNNLSYNIQNAILGVIRLFLYCTGATLVIAEILKLGFMWKYTIYLMLAIIVFNAIVITFKGK